MTGDKHLKMNGRRRYDWVSVLIRELTKLGDSNLLFLCAWPIHKLFDKGTDIVVNLFLLQKSSTTRAWSLLVFITFCKFDRVPYTPFLFMIFRTGFEPILHNCKASRLPKAHLNTTFIKQILILNAKSQHQ